MTNLAKANAIKSYKKYRKMYKVDETGDREYKGKLLLLLIFVFRINTFYFKPRL